MEKVRHGIRVGYGISVSINQRVHGRSENRLLRSVYERGHVSNEAVVEYEISVSICGRVYGSQSKW